MTYIGLYANWVCLVIFLIRGGLRGRKKAIGRARALTGTALSGSRRGSVPRWCWGGLASGPLAHGSVKKPWDSQLRLKTPLILSDFRDAACDSPRFFHRPVSERLGVRRTGISRTGSPAKLGGERLASSRAGNHAHPPSWFPFCRRNGRKSRRSESKDGPGEW